MRRLAIVVVILFVLAAGIFALRTNRAPEATASTDFIAALSGDDVAGYARALEPGAILFPRDLGAHDAYKTEWWYYTGNLATNAGREFGFQLTFFRTALSPPSQSSVDRGQLSAGDEQLLSTDNQQPSTESNWSTNQVYFAHFTISDITAEAFYPAEQFSRGAAGLAGAQAIPYRVWINDWSATEMPDGRVRLAAQTDEVALDLTLTQTLPPILHGDRGLSQKGAGPGNASYYYSFVRQQAEGSVRVGEETHAVTGLAWKDHEYSTNALEEGAVGWDWISLQFNDGTSLMLFEIRREDGSLAPWSSGSFISADGEVTHLSLEDWQLAVTDTWQSPASAATYPVAWTLDLPALDLSLQGSALMPNQELAVSTTYWEGAVGFAGDRAGQPITARGYIEMTGYGSAIRSD
jgi:predicted secreted hydrolase